MSSSPPSFDVPSWVASLADCSREEVAFTDQDETGDTLTTHYLCAGTTKATVELAALPMPAGRRGTWQLIARVGTQSGGAQLPATTRFIWR